jgi:hypothetical protein
MPADYDSVFTRMVQFLSELMTAQRPASLHPLLENLLLFVDRHSLILPPEVLCMVN